MRKVAPEVKKQINKMRVQHLLGDLELGKEKKVDIDLINKKLDKLIALVTLLFEEG